MTPQPVHAVYDGLFVSASFKKIDIRNPQPYMFTIDDIATGLSNICRFGGQISDNNYNVAQHSCLVTALAPLELKKVALLHDASEAFIGDVIKPLKVILGNVYTDIEDQFMRAIFERFNVDYNLLGDIKEFDLKMLEVEHEFIHGIDKSKLFVLVDKHFAMYPTVWNHTLAKNTFLTLYYNYFKNKAS